MDEKNILLQLCAHAPSPEVKNCVCKYDTQLNTKQLQKAFNSMRVGELIATLEYLKAPNLRTNLSEYKKEGLVMNIICCIENLLPDKCVCCDELYCTSMDDPSLLSCEKCGQEPHLECLIQKLGVPAEGLTQESVHKLLNPLDLNGWTYICPECKSDYIPSRDLDVKISALKKDTTNQNSSHPSTSQSTTPPNGGEEAQPDQEIRTGSPPSPNSEHDATVIAQRTTSPPPITVIGDGDEHFPSTISPQVCKDYLKFKCRSGKSGANCRFEHPSICSNLLDHGVKAPYGCNGKECSDFHPDMCKTSLAHQKCDKLHCEFFHMKGTIRKHAKSQNQKSALNNNGITRSQPKQAAKNNPNTSAGGRSQTAGHENDIHNFLEEVRLLKTELLEVMDTRFATLCSELMVNPQQQTTPVQAQNQQPIEPHPTTPQTQTTHQLPVPAQQIQPVMSQTQPPMMPSHQLQQPQFQLPQTMYQSLQHPLQQAFQIVPIMHPIYQSQQQAPLQMQMQTDPYHKFQNQQNMLGAQIPTTAYHTYQF